MKDKVMPNNSQVKFKKTEVKDHHRISSISNKKSLKCVFNSNHDSYVSKFLNDVNARTKKPKVPISTKQPKSQANKSVATPPMKTVALESTIIKSKSYYRMLYDKTSKAWKYTWTLFLRSKDETPEVIKDFLKMIQQNLQAPLIYVRTDRGIEFLNKTLHAYFKEEGIEHQTSTPRTPEQNDVIERRNHTLVEAARMMLSASKLPLFFWAEAIATTCYTQNRYMTIPTHKKTAYHIINDKKPLIRQLYIFGCTCYLTRDGENHDKKKGIRAFWPPDTTAPSQQVLDLLFCPLYDDFFNASNSSVNKSSSPTDNSAQQDTQPSMNIHPTIELTTSTNVNAEENNDNQAADKQFQQDEFINPFCTPVREVAESSSCNIDNSNMHTFYQPYDSEYRWKKDHPLQQVRGNPSKPEELHQFNRLQFWELVDKPFWNHLLQLLAWKLFGFCRICCIQVFSIYQMDVKIEFLNGPMKEEAKYALEILKKHGMEKCDTVVTPMATKPKLDADLIGKLVDQTDYHSKIRALMYLASSRPDIVQADYGFELIAFLDADHAGCIDTRKITFGRIQFL
ncbi:retrovirus-related pol polyprotein from transposon TNT 1-94, partial [Tanacetum coccineum]